MCDFDRILKTECNLLHFTRNCGVKNLVEGEEADTYLWREGYLNVKEKEITICYHIEQEFGNVSERRESKCCGVLMKHSHKVKGEQAMSSPSPLHQLATQH